MKKYAVWALLLLCAASALAAQSHPDVTLYVPPVIGDGGRPEDNADFYRMLVVELAEQNYPLAKTQHNADYSLCGILFPYTDEYEIDEYGTAVYYQYVFRLELLDNKTGEVTVDGELLYGVPEAISHELSVLVYTLLATIPDTGKDAWRNKLLYFGGNFFWSPRIYTGDEQATHLVNFGGGLSAEWHFTRFMAVGTGVEIAPDWVVTANGTNRNYRNILLEIPLLVKFVIKPGAWFMVEPYAGVHFNAPFLKTTRPPLLSWLAGFQYGVKAGSGVLFIDPRFSMDIGKSALEDRPGNNPPDFQRYIIHIGIGYKFGVLQKR